ncbi:MAG TPA: nuclear transport factor 2 family protein [Myxococcales bacterium]|jgi:steroid delta-isomerase-like uncharacterized protein
MAPSPREVVVAFFEAFNRHDVGALAALYAADAVNHQMPSEPLRGREAIRQSFAEAFRAVPDMGCEVVHVMVDGEWGAAEWQGWGTARAEDGSPRPYRMNGCGFFEVRDGRIVLQRGYWDSATMSRQAGLAL